MTTTPVDDNNHQDPADIFSGPDDLRNFLLVPDGSDLNLDLIETHNDPQAATQTPVKLTTPFTWVYTEPYDNNNNNNNDNKTTSPAPIQGVSDAFQTSPVQLTAVQTSSPDTAVPASPGSTQRGL